MRQLRALLLLVVASSACSRDKAAAANDTTAAAPSDPGAVALHAECCQQCASAAKRDPAASDLADKDCTAYAGEWNGQPGVDVKCVAHFGQVPTRVGTCWTEQPNLK